MRILVLHLKKAGAFWIGQRVISRSEMFDRAYYLAQIEHEQLTLWARLFPLWHYLLRADGALGVRPSAGFDPEWYLEAYPDVRSSGLNPLVHYLRFGYAEGRQPYRGARPDVLPCIPRSDRLERAAQQLWSGFSHIGLNALKALVHKRRFRDRAVWELARWEFAHGNCESALGWLKQSRSLGEKELSGLAKCYTVLEDSEALSRLALKFTENDAKARLVAANSASSPSRWLAEVNYLYERHGVAPLALASMDKPLSLGNLRGQVAPSIVDDDQPLVSVVVPACNAEETLAVTLDGLLAQTWSRLEIVVVDDGSVDGTASLAKGYAARDPRVRLVALEKNMGAYPARNAGMRVARGDFLTVHDSDDWSHPQKIELQVAPMLSNSKVVATQSRLVRVTAELRFLGYWMLGEHWLEPNASSWLMRREVVEKVGLWDEVRVAADTEFSWRVELHYGPSAMIEVSPEVPLSFALAAAKSLTRRKATHVSTIHFGLRRLYREAARWWHRHALLRPVMNSVRPFPVPLGMSNSGSQTFDRVIVGNFAVSGAELKQLLKALDSQLKVTERVCFMHWPNANAWSGNAIADEVFELCQRKGVNFAHPGLAITCPEVVLLSPELWRFPTSETVQVKGLGRVVDGQGEILPDQAALCRYFDQGGV